MWARQRARSPIPRERRARRPKIVVVPPMPPPHKGPGPPVRGITQTTPQLPCTKIHRSFPLTCGPGSLIIEEINDINRRHKTLSNRPLKYGSGGFSLSARLASPVHPPPCTPKKFSSPLPTSSSSRLQFFSSPFITSRRSNHESALPPAKTLAPDPASPAATPLLDPCSSPLGAQSTAPAARTGHCR